MTISLPDGLMVEPFFDAATSTFTYLLVDPKSQRAIVIDPVLDFEPHGARVSHAGADRILAYIAAQKLRVDWILETHIHADHLSAAGYLKDKLGARVGIGAEVRTVISAWNRIYDLAGEVPADGSQFDRLFQSGERIAFGGAAIEIWFTPGHTPACASYVGNGFAFVGDTIFSPQLGSARADFPGGDARVLYRSIRRLLAMPPATRLFLCHDYPEGDTAPQPQVTVAEQRARNIHVMDGTAEDTYVAMRAARDRALKPPKLILPAVQVNIRAGRLPAPDAEGRVFLKLPVDAI
jgi:glyoxylase-like metal-dependent hydrolase (beta-lactamase superfamily II)